MTESESIEATRERALARIRDNIERFGHHIYLIADDETMPRYAYTIGLLPDLGHELVFAGGALYEGEEVGAIVNRVAAKVRKARTRLEPGLSFELGKLGTFTLGSVRREWLELMLGAIDYHGDRRISAVQVLPEEKNWTLDTPRMSKSPGHADNRAWRYWKEDWDPGGAPRDSAVMTNLAALRGEPITQGIRWEEDEWEAFVGPAGKVRKSEFRALRLAVLIAIDDSLAPLRDLSVREGMYREHGDAPWERFETTSEP
ncbi:MAG: DUF4262 domain-containing protein [Deltaproteobacteria bacterium]|nr:DUF4262 domain-containing protein [Deltaproteobacteria bacterium]